MLDEASLELIRAAIREDLDGAGDVTSASLIDRATQGIATLQAKSQTVLAGTEAFEAACHEIDQGITVTWHGKDGDELEPATIIAHVEGRLAAILTAERTALNFLQHLSGVATLTRKIDDAAGRSVQIRDTRKTTPGMRALEKAAVRAGGGTNHRMGLYDAILIKDNHVAAAGGIQGAVERARRAQPSMAIEIECETLEQVRAAVAAASDEVLLDNMDLDTMRAAAAVCREVGVRTEASGGVTLDAVRAIAATGVDSISVGALTHSAPAADFSLEVGV